MKKNKLTKEVQVIDSKIKELAKTTKRKLTQVQLKRDYQLHGTSPKPKVLELKKQKWILVNKHGRLSGILDHIDFDTREKAKTMAPNNEE